MAWQKGGKPARLPGRYLPPGEQPTISAREPKDITFIVGTIKTVDPEKHRMTVELGGQRGTLENITISQPFAGNSSFIMGLPEEGSLVVIGYQDNRRFPVAYLPNITHGLENRNVKIWPNDIKTVEKNEHFFRVKKIQPGEIAFGSSGGIELHLAEKFVLDDRFGNKFVLKSDENSIISTACNHSTFGSGIWLNSGIIVRNSIDPADLTDVPNIFREPLSRGMYRYVLRPGGPNLDVAPYYTEYLLEVEDKGYTQQPENDINGDTNKTPRKPIGIFSMGNMVGNDPNVSGAYGRLLRPVLFTDVDDTTGGFALEPVSGPDIDTHGVAISWFKPDRMNQEIGAFFGIDKEGHFYQYIPAATGGGLGGGRAMSIVARGSKKEIWEADTRYANSWDLRTTGGVIWNIGTHNEQDGSPYSNRSMDIRTSSSVFYMYGTDIDAAIKDFNKTDTDVEDPRNYGKVEKISGKERHEVSHGRETIISGTDSIRIEGARVEQIIGARTVNVGSNYNVVVGDAFTEKVSKEKQEAFGNRKTTITSGSSELTVKATQGDIKEEITKQGGKFVKVKLGNIQETISVGDRTASIKSGSFNSKTTSGDIKSSTKTGQLSMQTKSGKAEFKASLNIDLKTKVASNVNLTGGTLNIKGKTNKLFKVITSGSHKDFITGAAHKGSSCVQIT